MQSALPSQFRPYGDSALGSTAFAGDQQAAILARAAGKLRAARQGAVTPAGADVKRTVVAAILAAFPVAILALVTFAVINDGTLGGAAFSGLLLLLIAAIPVIIFVSSRPTSPKAVLKQYLTCLARGKFGRARQLVVDPDLDDMPRVQPVIDKLGQPSGMTHVFRHDESFKAYWNGLLRSRPPCYCFVSLRNVQVTQLAPDVALVEAEVKFTMNTTLWALLIFVALLIAIIVDIATRTRVRVPVRKVLVKIGNEWRVFNAELMGADEHDLGWLGAPVEEYPPQPAAFTR